MVVKSQKRLQNMNIIYEVILRLFKLLDFDMALLS